MKTVHRLTAIGALLTATVLAQGPFGPRGAPPDPATMVAHQVERLTALLSLTSAQASQATTIFTNAAAAISPIQTTLNTDRTALHAAVKSNAIGTIDQLSTNMGTLTGQMMAIQNKADAAFYAILTSAQQATLDANGGFGGRGGFGRGPGGPPPGRP